MQIDGEWLVLIEGLKLLIEIWGAVSNIVQTTLEPITPISKDSWHSGWRCLSSVSSTFSSYQKVIVNNVKRLPICLPKKFDCQVFRISRSEMRWIHDSSTRLTIKTMSLTPFALWKNTNLCKRCKLWLCLKRFRGSCNTAHQAPPIPRWPPLLPLSTIIFRHNFFAIFSVFGQMRFQSRENPRRMTDF